MARIERTAIAEDDLAQIWSYIAEDSPASADRWLEQLEAVLQLPSRYSLLGPARDELAPAVKSFPFGEYVMFYLPSKNGILLVRVLSGFRNLEELLP